VSDGECRIARANREGTAACCGALEQTRLPDAGRHQRNVVLAPIIGQVRRAISVQLHLTLSDGCKVKARKGKTGSHDQPIAAQAAQVWQQTVGRYLTTE